MSGEIYQNFVPVVEARLTKQKCDLANLPSRTIAPSRVKISPASAGASTPRLHEQAAVLGQICVKVGHELAIAVVKLGRNTIARA